MMNCNNKPRRFIHNGIYAVTLLFTVPTFAQDSYSPYAERHYPGSVYWGDTHLHTTLSTDANALGNKRLGPDDAYRFARGQTLVAHNGMKVKLQHPLDFLVVADHGEDMGVLAGLENMDPVLLNTEGGRELFQRFQAAKQMDAENPPSNFFESALAEFIESLFTAGGVEGYRQPVWQRVIDMAERHNDPGKFTAFIGYEWTPLALGALGPHRVVIFKDGAEKAQQVLPFTTYDSGDPEDLWAFMDDYKANTGGDVLAIPHNGNLTAGAMFALRTHTGAALDRQYATTRSRLEPLFEVTQIKGDSETHPVLSPTDEFADYETMNPADVPLIENPVVPEDGLRQFEYARSGLKLGLQQQANLGVNPFKFGMIGSTDSHTSLATAEENNFWGDFTLTEPSPLRIKTTINWKLSASGYAAVWAKENTRQSLFEAMQRKEVYATTGPRMRVRFFGGWDFLKADAFKPDLALTGYHKGVPMGGDLTNAPIDKAPSFLIRAVKDPDGANLDRVQVIKGWLDKQGGLHEKVYDVALADKFRRYWHGEVRSVGNTVDVENASYKNIIGDPELVTVWRDPDFDRDELAFYYVRVIEIPTPRWTAYDAKFFGLERDDEMPVITQERAYTSPIWYTP